MNDHTNETIFNIPRIDCFARLLILRWAIAVKSDHGIFHPAALPSIDRLGGGVRIVESKFIIDIHCMDDGLR